MRLKLPTLTRVLAGVVVLGLETDFRREFRVPGVQPLNVVLIRRPVGTVIGGKGEGCYLKGPVTETSERPTDAAYEAIAKSGRIAL